MPPVPDAFLRIASVSYIEFGDRGGSDREILRDVSLAAAQGEVVALFSSEQEARAIILRMVAGLLKPTSGFISVHKKRVERPGPDRSFVLKDTVLFPWLTLQQNMEEAIRATAGSLLPSQIRDEALECLRQAGLSSAAQSYPSKLTKAEQSWAGIARSMATKPDVLLLEDPFSTLTPRERVEVQDRLKDSLARTPRSVLISTDDMDIAVQLADRVALLSPTPAAHIHQLFSVKGIDEQLLKSALKEGLDAANQRTVSVRLQKIGDV